MSEEMLQLVDRRGKPVGTAARSVCHGDPDLIQAVVHLHIFDPAGRMYLQRRAACKQRFPGRWDTGVGGHAAAGENPEQAIRREAREELGIELDDPSVVNGLIRLEPYLYRDEVESEYVSAFRAVYTGVLHPNPEEVAEGRFFEPERIRGLLERQPERFTPHFRQAFAQFLPDIDSRNQRM